MATAVTMPRLGLTMVEGTVVEWKTRPGEAVETRMVRFRTLGCYPLTGAVESEAANLTDIIAEMRSSRSSERHGRVIDHDGSGSMEQKKQEGYF